MGNGMGGAAEAAALLQPGLHGAFVADGFATPPQAAVGSGPLAGLRLAVKDVFEVAGQRMGAGSPTWFRQQAAARSSALAVQILLDAGAAWVGKTVTDELAFGLSGRNIHYGTPVNPTAPGHIPGGSSSGSAVAVAAGHADIGLGTDCGGSCRLPASYCGVWGIRPTQGRIAGRGCFSLAHSFDAVGWFAADGTTLARVFEALTGERVPTAVDAAFTIPEDALAVAGMPVRRAFQGLVDRTLWPLDLSFLPEESLPLSHWAQAHRVLQGAEIWQQHGAWVGAHGVDLADDVRQRFLAASRITPGDVTEFQKARVAATRQLGRLLDGDATLLVLPTVPGIAPRLDEGAEAMEVQRAASQQLLCLAGLAGLPQVSLPWTAIDGAPLGLSVIGARGADALTIAAARQLHALLTSQAAA